MKDEEGKCKLLHQYCTYFRFLFRYHRHMDQGVGFDHRSGWQGHLGADISLIHNLRYFCSKMEAQEDRNPLFAFVVGKVIVI